MSRIGKYIDTESRLVVLGVKEEELGNNSFSQIRAVFHMYNFWGLGHGRISLGITIQSPEDGN